MVKWDGLSIAVFAGVCVVLNLILVLILRKLKGFQAIYERSPQTHQDKKSTPSFGGIGIFLGILIGTVLFKLWDLSVLWLISVFTVFCVIGFTDDYLSILKKTNKGLSAKQKFLLQVLAAFYFMVIFHVTFHPLAWWEMGLFLFMMVGTSNATNLTDGLDGLLAGLSLCTLGGFALYAHYLGAHSLFAFAMICMIAVGGFLLFNLKPAKVFMGDTGSLALGALFAGFAFQLRNPWILIPLGAVYILETLSVMIQVGYFKRMQKRIFLMTPLHHHFELLGFSERRVVRLFWAFGVLFLLLFVLLYLPNQPLF
ncbi:MAG: phospho-N-acetylmuramoyl-pentapeptide-transferase [Candidatus Margulisiibacteriota bacterium]